MDKIGILSHDLTEPLLLSRRESSMIVASLFVFNQLEFTRALFAHRCFRHTEPAVLNLIVIDNRSTDRSRMG